MHLRIKAFYGTSDNAVKTQLWITISVYVLVAVVRKRLGTDDTLSQLLRAFSVALFEETPMLRAFQGNDIYNELYRFGNRLIPFNF